MGKQLVAIIGMSCRFSGDLDTPESLWRSIRDGKETIGAVPRDREWGAGEFYDSSPRAEGKFYVRDGYFLHNPYSFDADFFGISPREARAVDPQQRIMLELAWESIERSGIDPLRLSGSRSGVFVGNAMGGSYYSPSRMAGKGLALDQYWVTGTSAAMLSGRISYMLGTEGPALTFDTGCSSGLVAFHQACQSLRSGESDLALIGGVAVMVNPDPLLCFSRQQALAPDGRCKPFAAAADGTSFAEGAVMLVAERLSDARRYGHPVLAVVRGSALNQDGATSDGLAAPSTHAQIKVIESALRDAGLAPGDIDAVEAHGTGTAVGDPIEANALIETYGQERRVDDPIWVGSVKSNIGHTQGAAGLAGIVKMILAMEHGHLPKTLHIDRPTPSVDWNRGAVRLLTDSMPWPGRGHPRRAGISSFGISGTNGHVILEAPSSGRRRASTRTCRVDSAARTRPAVPILLSAKSAAALRDQARRLAQHPVISSNDIGMQELGNALATTRSLFSHRAVLLPSNQDHLRSQLLALASDEAVPGTIVGKTGHPGKVAFVFPGQGAQWVGMAVRLIRESRVFSRYLSDCDDALAPYLDWSLLKVLRDGPDSTAIGRIDMVQPILFAIAVSLAGLWRSMGVIPDAVVGHSQGEIAAAHVCGALSLDEAARVSALRAKALEQLVGTGAMVHLPLSVADTERLLADRGPEISVAVINGPESTTVSGTTDAMNAFLREVIATGVEARRIPVDYASHSAQVEPVRADLDCALSGLSPTGGDVPFYSTVTGGLIDAGNLDAAYWWENLRRPVRFADAILALHNDGYRTFIEPSPHPVLRPAIHQTLDGVLPADETVTVVGSLRRDRGSQDQFLTEVAKAFVVGVPVDWKDSFGKVSARHVNLPTYPFQRKTYKLDSADGRADARLLQKVDDSYHPQSSESGFHGECGLYRIDWVKTFEAPGSVPQGCVAVVGSDVTGLSADLRSAMCEVTEYSSLDDLLRSVPRGIPIPHEVLIVPPKHVDRDSTCASAADAHAVAAWALSAVQTWLEEDRASRARLTILTENSIACELGDRVTGLAGSVIWGLVRSAQSEHPGRVALIDIDDSDESRKAVPAALASREPQLTVREGEIRIPRLVADSSDSTGILSLPAEQPWRLSISVPGTLSGLELQPALDGMRPLGRNDVRISVRAAGLNFRDVLVALGTSPVQASLGCEVAGSVVAVGSDVTSFAVGDRVMGIAEGYMGSLAIAEDQLLARIPNGWSFVEAATVPVTFLTAYYGLKCLADVKRGDKVLIHAAAGGVGIAAVQLARFLGAEVFATASPGKQSALKAAGIPDDHIASSRTPEFCNAFLWATGGAGVDVVLNSLTGELLNASLDLLRQGGRFIEIGKLDGRSAAELAESYPEVRYHAFDLMDLEAGEIREILKDLNRHFESGDLSPLPLRTWDIRRAPEAFRFMRDSRHTGKIVLTVPVEDDSEGTLLITGGTGVAGSRLARHLVSARGARHLLLVSRRGEQAPGARKLVADLGELGASVTVASCDVTDPEAVKALVATIPAEHPLTSVVHAAAVLDDGAVSDMTQDRLGAVLAPKVDAAWNLYNATRHCDLSAFTMFSSVVGTLGLPGQGNYAAANAFLDSFASYLRGHGVPAASLAWGTWEAGSGLIDFTPTVTSRLAREEGLVPISSARAFELYDQALGTPYPCVVLAGFDAESLRARKTKRLLRPVLGELVPNGDDSGTLVSVSTESDLPLPADLKAETWKIEDMDSVLELVLAEVGNILEYDEVEVTCSLRDLGFDSLSFLELANRLSRVTGLSVQPRLVRDCQTPSDLAILVHAQVSQREKMGKRDVASAV